MDMVLLGTGRSEPEEVLPVLLEHLQSDTTLQDVTMWYIKAVACLLKVVYQNQSADILFLSGCQRPSDDDDEFRVFSNQEAVFRSVISSAHLNTRRRTCSRTCFHTPRPIQGCVKVHRCAMPSLVSGIGLHTSDTDRHSSTISETG